MTAKLSCLLSSILAISLAGCTAAPAPVPDTRDADAKAIRQIEASWSQAMASRDVNKITAYYADDASLSMTGMPIINKRANIITLDRKLLLDRAYDFSFTMNKVTVARSGDMAYTQGAYEMKLTDQDVKRVVSEKGKYVNVYEKQADNTWKAVSAICNADGPRKVVK